MKLDNKTIWITGASSGIGRQLALDLAQKNCKLILSARNQDKLNEVKSACLKFTKDVTVLPLDLEEIDTLAQKAQEAIDVFGKLDVLFNNGGISQRSLIIDMISLSIKN